MLVAAAIAQNGSGRSVSTDPLLESLPASLQQNGRLLLASEDEAKRAEIAGALARQGSAVEFLTMVLDREPSARVRAAIVDRLGRHFDPRVMRSLERLASSDPDAKVSILASERLREQHAQSTLQAVNRRLEMARQEGRREDLLLLAEEQDRLITLANGGALPGFMRKPPPVFEAKPAEQPVRVLAFGDYGQGTSYQRNTAAAMLAYHRSQPFDFAITLGDNFYPRGMESPADPRWNSFWDELYDPLEIRFYASLGNHDWGMADSPAAEVLYSAQSPTWRLPATRYSFTAGEAQFFAIDTNVFSEAQAIWLQEALEKSAARWKVVFGHHPIYSHGQHGDTQLLIERLLPVLEGRADVFLAGHEHDLQHLKPIGRLHLFISGGGGAKPRPITPGPRSLFSASTNGFAVLDIDARSFKVTFVDHGLKTLYEYAIAK